MAAIMPASIMADAAATAAAAAMAVMVMAFTSSAAGQMILPHSFFAAVAMTRALFFSCFIKPLSQSIFISWLICCLIVTIRDTVS